MAKKVLKKFSIIGPVSGDGRHGDEWFRIHDAACSDIKKEDGLWGGNGHWDVDAVSAEALLKTEMDELNSQNGKDVWSKSQWYICPCAKNSEAK